MFKEMVANADDAGANSVIIAIDRNGYDEANLWDEGLKTAHAGPAILVYNDAEFSESDWKNMTSNFANSLKRQDEEKIGKWGLGLSSAFNYTDVIECMSGDFLLLLDPHAKYLTLPTNQGSQTSRGKKASLRLQLDKLYEKHPGLLQALEIPAASLGISEFDVSESSRHYKGTLFRFPLRTAAMAESSKISTNGWDSQGKSDVHIALSIFTPPSNDLV